jgi:serine/threonine protein kinase
MSSSNGAPISKYYPSGYTIIAQDYFESGNLLSYLTNSESSVLSTSQVLTLFHPILKFLSTLHEDHELALLNLSASKVLISRMSDGNVPTALHFYDVSICRGMVAYEI